MYYTYLPSRTACRYFSQKVDVEVVLNVMHFSVTAQALETSETSALLTSFSVETEVTLAVARSS